MKISDTAKNWFNLIKAIIGFLVCFIAAVFLVFLLWKVSIGMDSYQDPKLREIPHKGHIYLSYIGGSIIHSESCTNAVHKVNQ